jgi:uracil phosphoribosyltransferase
MKETVSGDFRRLLKELTMLLAYEVTKDLPLVERSIQTPLQQMNVPVLAGEVSLISILRAGNGMLDGMLEVLPSAKVGHIGIYREPTTLCPVEYYFKVPPELSASTVILVDPMLATGNSAAAAISRLKDENALSIRFVCLVASPAGVERTRREHPDVQIFTAAVDERLDARGYIVPGLGDAGDRIYGTSH